MGPATLLDAELARFDAEHPRSRALAAQARSSLLGGVPMHWMVRWPGQFPVYAVGANGDADECGSRQHARGVAAAERRDELVVL